MLPNLDWWEKRHNRTSFFFGEKELNLYKKAEMEKDILSYILPEGLLEYFIITQVEETKDEATKTKVLRIELEEKNQIPSG